jgi:hypothetical protein
MNLRRAGFARLKTSDSNQRLQTCGWLAGVEPVRHNIAGHTFPRRLKSIIFNLLSAIHYLLFTVLLFLQYF